MKEREVVGERKALKRIVVFFLSIVLIFLFYYGFNTRNLLFDRNLVVGEPVAEGIVATHDFGVPFSREVHLEMQKEVEESLPVYLRRNEETALNSARKIKDAILEETGDEPLAEYFRQRLLNLYSTGIVDMVALRQQYGGNNAVIDNTPVSSVSELFTLSEARDGIRLDLERRRYPSGKIPELLELIVPNLSMDLTAREEAVREAIAQIPVLEHEYKTGQEILPPGGVVTDETKRICDAMVLSPEHGSEISTYHLARTGIATILVFLGVLYVSNVSGETTFSGLFLLFTIWGAALGFTALIARLRIQSLSMFSFTMLGAGLTSIFFDNRPGGRAHHLAWVLTAIFASLVAVASPYPIASFLLGFVPGCIVAVAIRNIEDSDISNALVAGVVSSFVVYWLIAKAGTFASMSFEPTVWLAVVVVPLLVIGVVRIVVHPLEIVFGMPTALTYRRLDNDNHPLRKRLFREARGTYNHSRVVADLASDAAAALGANEKLARIAGMFHDIGKLSDPGMYIENIANPDKNNPHLRMSPLESAKIIISHVEEGVRLAKKNNFPSDVIDIIEQHHGNTSARYFLEKAKRELPPGGELDESAFHYRARRPQSIEAVLVMLADSVSAAIKGFGGEVSYDEKAAVVSRIIDEKAAEGQFDDSNFTVSMRKKVAHIFMDQLNKKEERVKDYPYGKY